MKNTVAHILAMEGDRGTVFVGHTESEAALLEEMDETDDFLVALEWVAQRASRGYATLYDSTGTPIRYWIGEGGAPAGVAALPESLRVANPLGGVD